MTDRVRIILKDMPTTIRGFVCLGSDYEPIIVINSRLPFEQQQMVYIHEFMHIKNGQIYDDNYIEYGDPA